MQKFFFFSQSIMVPPFMYVFTIFLLTCTTQLNGPRLFVTAWPRLSDLSFLLSDNSPGTTAEQVHISLAGQDGSNYKIKISWITKDYTPAFVEYKVLNEPDFSKSTTGTTDNYRYRIWGYKSGTIHDAVIGPLLPSMLYFFRVDGVEYSFKTPPAQFPVRFAVVGDINTNDDSNRTLQRIMTSNYDVMLLTGDLAYALTIQRAWDTFGRLVEPMASQRPWLVTPGEQDKEQNALFHPRSFTAYKVRWRMAYEDSGSDSPLYYSFNVAGVHVISLGSYADYDPDSSQYKWLVNDLGRVDRTKTPWILVFLHVPWYTSNGLHENEQEAVDMRKFMEGIINTARVDVIFSGHVHGYQRLTRINNRQPDKCAPVYITVGTGGATGKDDERIFNDPGMASLSRFTAEKAFGYGNFEVVNASHALWSWYKNDDNPQDAADSIWIPSLSSDPTC